MKNLNDMSLEELWQLFPIMLREYNPHYKTWYEEEKRNLLHILKDHRIYRINHIGSTSVPGLMAKPIVDILLELPGDYDMDAAAALLQNAGWLIMRRDEAQRILDLNKGYTPEGFAEKVFHLHIKTPGDWGELYFRDYLRQYPEAARQYEGLKQNLKEQFEHNRDAYTDAKSGFVAEHTQKARKEFGQRYFPQ
ncbi:GrpB family protein [Treponema sp. OttesenSCG-928-L16]|nr:GrpB family protein [Treponema sp. OttesenSCG-928-L16]